MRLNPRVAWLPAAALLFSCCAARAEVEYTGKTFPDPFAEMPGTKSPSDPKKQLESKVDLSGLTVEGIILSPDGNLAIVKGKVVKAGDSVKGFLVHAIEADGVLFSYGAGGQKKIYKITHKGQAKP